MQAVRRAECWPTAMRKALAGARSVQISQPLLRTAAVNDNFAMAEPFRPFEAATAQVCRNPAFLREQINSILKFYAPVVRDPRGGFHNQLLDDGTARGARRRWARYTPLISSLAANNFLAAPGRRGHAPPCWHLGRLGSPRSGLSIRLSQSFLSS